MKLFSVNQIQDADAYTMLHEPIASHALMERAAISCVGWITHQFSSANKITIVCGPGNNGGDGLAIARLLHQINYLVEVIIINPSLKTSVDFEINSKRLPPSIHFTQITSIDDLRKIHFEDTTILIDAILGSGLNKPLEGVFAEVVHVLNKVAAIKISIDVPTGLFCDKLNDKNDCVFIANYTLSFQFPKLSFLFVENAKYIGSFSILDIQLHPDYIFKTPSFHYFVDKQLIRSFFKQRSFVAHKGNFGHGLLLCGSYGKMGAAVLSSKAFLKSGAGMLTINVPACGYEILQTAVPEAMVKTDTNKNYLRRLPELKMYESIGVGCGIGVEEETQQIIKSLIQNTLVPIVFDADAINCLAMNKTWLSFLPEGCIFTPHIKEFERLVGESNSSEERLKKQLDFSMKYKAIVVLKGHHTSITNPQGEIYFNSTGNSGMATAGSGDVLLGIITALFAQGYSSLQAAVLGVYLHGLAGDFAANKLSEESMIASDIVNHLSDAFHFLKS